MCRAGTAAVDVKCYRFLKVTPPDSIAKDRARSESQSTLVISLKPSRFRSGKQQRQLKKIADRLYWPA
jgi:hypothetical protein